MTAYFKSFIAATTLLVLISGSAIAGERINLKVETAGTYIIPAYQEIATGFMANHPDISVTVTAPNESWDDMVQRTLRDGITNSLPDVTEQGLNTFQAIADKNLAVPIEDLDTPLSALAIEGHSKALLALGEYNGKHWGLPFRLATPIIYVNGDLVRSAGGNPESLPQNWEELMELAHRITALGNGRMGAYIDYQADGAWMFLTLLNLEGGRAMTPDGRVAFDGPEGLRAMNWLHKAALAGMVDLTRPQARQSFIAGKIGFFVTAGSLVEAFKGQIADRFEFRTASLPRPAATSRIPVGGGLLMVNTNDPARRKAAWDFVRYATGPDAQTILVRKTGMMPSNTIPATLPQMLGSFYAENPLHRANLDQLAVVTDWFAFPGQNAVQITHLLRDGMQKIVTLQKSPEEGLKQMADQVRQRLPQK